jgi:hypothetical protein
MPLKVYVNGAAKDPARATVRVLNATKTVRRIEVYDDGAWRVGHSFIQPVTLSISPGDVSGFGSGVTNQTIYTDVATALPAGGKGPFTYAWTRTGGDAVSIASPSSASTSFYMFLQKFDEASATFQCLCTDSLGQTATATCTAILRN